MSAIDSATFLCNTIVFWIIGAGSLYLAVNRIIKFARERKSNPGLTLTKNDIGALALYLIGFVGSAIWIKMILKIYY